MFHFRSCLSPACRPGCCIRQRPQGGLSVFILKQILDSVMVLSSRIHSRHVILDPLHFSLSPVSSRNVVVRVVMSFVQSSSSLTVDYTISMNETVFVTH